MKTLDNVLEEFTGNWRGYSYYYDKQLSDKRRTKDTRRKYLIEEANHRRTNFVLRNWHGKFYYGEYILTDEELFYSNNSWSEKIINFICHYEYDFLYRNFSDRQSKTLKWLFQYHIERANDIKQKKVKKDKLELALSQLHKEDLVQLLMLKDKHLQDMTTKFQKFETNYVENEQKTIKAGQKMRAYRGLACVVLDMDVQTVNKILNNVRKNKVTLQKALGK